MNILNSKHTVYLLVVALIVYSLLNFPGNPISWDVFGYYLYLPAFFIFNDLGISNPEWVHDIISTYNSSGTFYQAALTPLNYYVINYSMGMAISYAPFFLVAHAVALLFGYNPDGFSLPYQAALVVCNWFYIALGLIYLSKVLRHFFTNRITIFILLIVVLGTNYFQISYANAGMSHMFLFSFYALLMWRTIKWKENLTLKNTVIIGLICGLIILSRPTELVCLFIPLFWGIDKISIKERLSFVRTNFSKFLVFTVILILIGGMQFLYWKKYAGSFVYMSYTNKGEGLDFLAPHTINTLFSFRKGWLVYTPVMIFSLIGMYFMYKQNKKIFYSVLAYFIFNLYLVSTWSNWWYAVSFSQRALMQSYAVLALPLGYFIANIGEFKRGIKWALTAVIFFFVGLNLFQIWQMDQGIIDGSRMTKDYYFSVFGQTNSPTDEQKELLLIKRTTTNTEVFEHQEKYHLTSSDLNDFENEEGMDFDKAFSGNKVLIMDQNTIFSKAFRKPFKEITESDHAWIKISAMVFPSDNWQESELSLVVAFEHKGESYKYRTANLPNDGSIIPNQWNKIELEYLTPEVRTKDDELATYMWLRGSEGLYIDDFRVEIFNKVQE
jgi:hypothetical protein